MKKALLIIAGVIVLIVLLLLGYLGFIPGLSTLMGSNKPRDLGVTYTDADRQAARDRSQVEFQALPADTPDELSLQRIGSRPVTASFSSSEITALMNDRPYKYWPYKDVQIKFNADGTTEVSGALIKTRVPGYCAAIGIPKEMVAKIMHYLPSEPIYYVKGKASLVDNKVAIFEPEKFELGRMPLPVGMFLSKADSSMTAYALDTNELSSDLSKASGKKAIIINYINDHLASIKGFFAKSAYSSEDKLNFDGNLNETELTTR
ncbi:hypothetical protein A2215_02460 [Candidatus Berkelbacteria bacterium RIFOXYA2_FULL_43_10]|uniref:Uncharacterized protein n=1 Tax=Candidatus Berkelbacteria bacterium RIFOXYA2_FULL_43_10 TaxID=1797472 RepID=A0A1F5ECN6_9BACT|nr:MAG: hypothetical protein A2215_02460 [Candidatus Berkelbacteria bacterium RIFOXYA2_FULL_43_10]